MTVTLVCRTLGCGNADIPIVLDVEDDVDAFLCGVCGQAIPTPSPS